MVREAQVVLIPGFFGFSQLAGIPYFDRAAPVLRAALAEQGIGATIRELEPPPAASLPERAARIAEVLAEFPKETELHLVGHSSGSATTPIPEVRPAHFDGFSSASGFDRQSFVELWASVASHIARQQNTHYLSPEITLPTSTRWAQDAERRKKELLVLSITAPSFVVLWICFMRLALDTDWTTILIGAAAIVPLFLLEPITRRWFTSAAQKR